MSAIETFAKSKGGSKKPISLSSSLKHVSNSTDRLVDKLNVCLKYVTDVCDGPRKTRNDDERQHAGSTDGTLPCLPHKNTVVSGNQVELECVNSVHHCGRIRCCSRLKHCN